MTEQKLQTALEQRANEVTLTQVWEEFHEFLRSRKSRYTTTHGEWFWKRSPTEKVLYEKVCSYQDRYFKDMTLQKYVREFVTFEVETGYSTKPALFDALSDALPGQWRFLIVPDGPDWSGYCYTLDWRIEMTESYRNNKIVILHEMIHAYEAILDDYQTLKEWLVARLYRDLAPRIKDLDRYLSTNAHPYWHVHRTLFILKSLDLDLRLKRKLGSVYSYGRDDLFADISRIAKERQCSAKRHRRGDSSSDGFDEAPDVL